MVDIQRTNQFLKTGQYVETHGFEGANSGVNFMVPLRFGYEFKFYNAYDQPNIRLDIGYQHNLTFGEGLMVITTQLRNLKTTRLTNTGK
jgi:hypothetical protein